MSEPRTKTRHSRSLIRDSRGLSDGRIFKLPSSDALASSEALAR